jgi:glycosyltransferase involved in cell wall biosynthesis
VVQAYRDKRLSYYYQENQDAFNTINRGLGMAKGDYVAILNSDDIYTTDRLEKMIKAQQKDGAACLFSDVVPISDEGEEFSDPEFGWNIWHRKNRDWFFECRDLYTAFLKGNFMVPTSNLFMTAEAVRKVGKFCSLRYLHDYDFMFRMMLAYPGRVQYLDSEKLLYYRIHSGNTLGEAAVLGREQDMEVIRRYMLAALPDQYRGLAAAGSDRLVDLERELQQVRSELRQEPETGVREQVRALGAALGRKMKKVLGKS